MEIVNLDNEATNFKVLFLSNLDQIFHLMCPDAFQMAFVALLVALEMTLQKLGEIVMIHSTKNRSLQLLAFFMEVENNFRHNLNTVTPYCPLIPNGVAILMVEYCDHTSVTH